MRSLVVTFISISNLFSSCSKHACVVHQNWCFALTFLRKQNSNAQSLFWVVHWCQLGCKFTTSGVIIWLIWLNVFIISVASSNWILKRLTSRVNLDLEIFLAHQMLYRTKTYCRQPILFSLLKCHSSMVLNLEIDAWERHSFGCCSLTHCYQPTYSKDIS